VVVIAHRVANSGAAYASNHSANWPADNSAADRACHASGQSAALIR
jgi:hypothetical protein